MTDPEQKILAALSRYALRSGPLIQQMTGFGPGSLYPALLRLENEGKIVSRWEGERYPRRRVYSLAEVVAP